VETERTCGRVGFEITDCDLKKQQIHQQERTVAVAKTTSLIPAERIERSILLLRGHNVMLDMT